MLPDAFDAVTVTTLAPGCSSTCGTDQEEIPCFVVTLAVPEPPRLFAHVTDVTPTLSVAVPLIATRSKVVVKVEADVGAAIEMFGGGVPGEVTDSASVAVWPAVSLTVIVITFVPTNKGMAGVLQKLVPFTVPVPPRSFPHVSAAMASSSLAVPPTTIVLLPVE